MGFDWRLALAIMMGGLLTGSCCCTGGSNTDNNADTEIQAPQT